MFTIRLFTAVSLSAEQIEEVKALQRSLKLKLEGVRWVKPEALHLTLNFIGETKPERLELVKNVLRTLKTDFKRFTLNLEGVGVFPAPHRARVLWLGLGQGQDKLSYLARALAEGLESSGFKTEKRKYEPHLTIGRIREPLEEKVILEHFLKEHNFKSAASVVEHLTLFESTLTGRGAIYSALEKKIFSDH